jgi:hypothetical protein
MTLIRRQKQRGSRRSYLDGKNMKWLSIYKDGQPNSDQRVLTYSECYKGKPELAFRVIDGQFVRLCSEVTHYCYLQEPDNQEIQFSGNQTDTIL